MSWRLNGYEWSGCERNRYLFAQTPTRKTPTAPSTAVENPHVDLALNDPARRRARVFDGYTPEAISWRHVTTASRHDYRSASDALRTAALFGNDLETAHEERHQPTKVKLDDMVINIGESWGTDVRNRACREDMEKKMKIYPSLMPPNPTARCCCTLSHVHLSH